MKKNISRGVISTLFGLFALVYTTKAAGSPKFDWNEGAIVLANAQVLTGEIFVHTAYDLVLFRNNNQITVFPAHKLHSFLFFDQKANINRRYISQASVKNGFKQYGIYEVVVRGEISVIRKQNKVRSFHLSDAFDFDYFVVMQDELVWLGQFREKIYPSLLACCETHMLSYLKEEHLNPNLQADAIRLIQFYNKVNPSQFFPQARNTN